MLQVAARARPATRAASQKVLVDFAKTDLANDGFAALRRFSPSGTSSPPRPPTHALTQEAVALDADIAILGGLEACLPMNGIEMIRMQARLVLQQVQLRLCVCVRVSLEPV